MMPSVRGRVVREKSKLLVGAGDVIETVGGELIPGPDQSFDFSRTTRPLTLGIIRAGQKINIQLK